MPSKGVQIRRISAFYCKRIMKNKQTIGCNRRYSRFFVSSIAVIAAVRSFEKNHVLFNNMFQDLANTLLSLPEFFAWHCAMSKSNAIKMACNMAQF